MSPTQILQEANLSAIALVPAIINLDGTLLYRSEEFEAYLPNDPQREVSLFMDEVMEGIALSVKYADSLFGVGYLTEGEAISSLPPAFTVVEWEHLCLVW